MNRHGRLFDQIASFPNLLAAAKAARRGKRFRTDAYRPGPYPTFVIRDPKTRLISAAPYRDRVVHHAIRRVIEPIVDRALIADSFACRAGKGTHAALDRATQFVRRFPYALKCDVEKFSPSAT